MPCEEWDTVLNMSFFDFSSKIRKLKRFKDLSKKVFIQSKNILSYRNFASILFDRYVMYKKACKQRTETMLDVQRQFDEKIHRCQLLLIMTKFSCFH
jgi:hypothetical protein